MLAVTNPPRPGRARRGWTITLLVLAALAAVPGAATAVLGLFPGLHALWWPVAAAAAFLHWGVFAWALAVLLALAARRVARRRAAAAVVTALAVAGLALQVSWLVPSFVPDAEPVAGEALVVLTLNVEVGTAADEPAEIARLAGQADVVVLQEVTRQSVADLGRAGLDERFPHRIGEGEAGASGTVVYSRFPLELVAWVPTSLESVIVRAHTPDGPLTIAGVHPMHPMGPWVADAATVREALRPHLGERLVVAGDFNAVDRHLTMRDLADDGLRDAVDVAGAGWVCTWPADRAFPPVVGIDHVLVSASMTALEVRPVEVAGTDHAGLLVTVAPRGEG